MKKIAKHIPHYFILLGIFSFGVIGFLIFSYDKAFQLSVATALAISYFAWGVIHHMIHKDLHISVVIEYAMISILGLTVVISVIFGS